MVIATVTLAEYIFGWNFGFDHLFIQDHDLVAPLVPTIRMSAATAFLFLLFGVILLIIPNRRYVRVVHMMTLVMLVISLLVVAGYLFQVSSLLSISMFSNIALTTAVCFSGVACVIFLTTAHEGIIAPISQNHLGGLMARRLLPIIVILPLVGGWLRLQGQNLGYYGTEFGVAIHAVSNIFILSVVVWWTARKLNQIDIENQQARTHLQHYNRRLEILHQIDAGIIAHKPVPELIAETIKQLREIIPCERVGIGLVDEATGDLDIYSVDTDLDNPFESQRLSILPTFFDGFDENNVRLFDDLQMVRGRFQFAENLLKKGFQSILQVKMIQDGRPIGMLNLVSTHVAFFTDEYREMAAEVANQLSIVIKQLRLSETIKEANETLERRVMERTAELNAAKEKVEAILNNSSDGILLSSVDLNIETVNPAFEKMFGHNLEANTSLSLLDMVEEEDSERIASTVRSALVGDRTEAFEVRARREDGTLFDAELSIGHIVGAGLVSTVHDITRRKATERQLRFQASIQNTVADAVIATDLDFRIQSWNKAAERIYGWREQEVIGKPIREVLQTEVSPDQQVDEVRRIFVEQGHWIGEVTQRHRSSKPIHILSSSVLFKDSNAAPFGVLIVNHDISERKHAEDALRNTLTQEKELNEMKSRFISIASHEFRTPLASISATTESLLNYRGKMNAEQVDERLHRILLQVTQMTAIMSDVVESSRMQGDYVNFKPAQGNLDALLRDIVQEFSERAEGQGRIQYHVENPTLLFRFDPRLMRQVVSNMLGNALKYSASDQAVSVTLVQDSRQITITVTDTGIGIPEADLPHMFQPFHRAANVGDVPGTGLGMNIARKAVEMHGGTISVASVVGQGSVFTVVLPAAPT